jgi:hypothetical protein
VPKKSKTPTQPLYRRKPPQRPHSGRAVLPRRQADQQVSPANDIPHAYLIPPAHFALRDDGSISAPSTHNPQLSTQAAPRLAFSDSARGIWLYHGNCLELLDAIAAKYPDGRFDAIFADPPAWP